jgi:hypothetical protein
VSADKSPDNLPDVRDGLSRKARIVLYLIDQIQTERGGRNVPTVMLYGRVLELMEMSMDELQAILQRFSTDNSQNTKPWDQQSGV